MNKTIQKLPVTFEGAGEVKGYTFNLFKEFNDYFCYQVTDGESVHYELFEKKETPICVDFEKRIYSDSEFKYRYPKSREFGMWAWSLPSIEKVYSKVDELAKTN